MAELVVKLERAAKFANNEMFSKGARVRVTGRAIECLKLVKYGLAVPMLADAADLPNGVDGILVTPPGPTTGEPQTLEATRKRYREVLLKKAQELALTATSPLPAGKSWFDLAAEQRWAKLEARREAGKAAEEAAHAELLGHFQNEAARQEAEAEAALERAKLFREQAARASELVSFEAAAQTLKVARDTFETFEQASDPRASEAKERLDVAEAKFAEAERVKLTYEARVRLKRAQDKISALGSNVSDRYKFPRERIDKALECSSAAQVAIDAGNFHAVEDALRELAESIELPRSAGLPIVTLGETLGVG